MRIADTLRNGLEVLGLAPSAKSQQLAEALIQESDATRLRIRQEQATERAAISAEQLARVEAYDLRRAAAVAAVERKQAERDDAFGALQAMERAEHEAMFPLDRRHDHLGSALLTSASPRIEESVAELRAAWTATWGQRDDIVEKCIDGTRRLSWSNRDSIERRATAIHEAIAVVQALVFEPLDDAALESRLDAIRAALPDVESRPAQYSSAALTAAGTW